MKEHLIQLVDYELWANRRVVDALESVRNPPARAIAVMGHILSAQHVWFGRIIHESIFVAIWEDIPISWMIETAERQHRQVHDYLSSQTESDLLHPIAYANSKGVSYQSSLFDIMTHLSHHAAYHRGQVVQLIRPMIQEPPVTDFIVWTRER